MNGIIQKWGNSLAIRIPKAIAEQSRVGAGAEVEMLVERGHIVLKPRSPHQFSLKRLLAGVTKANRRAEVTWGEATGREAW